MFFESGFSVPLTLTKMFSITVVEIHTTFRYIECQFGHVTVSVESWRQIQTTCQTTVGLRTELITLDFTPKRSTINCKIITN